MTGNLREHLPEWVTRGTIIGMVGILIGLVGFMARDIHSQQQELQRSIVEGQTQALKGQTEALKAIGSIKEQLDQRLHEVEKWRAETAANRFTIQDWTRERASLDAVIQGLDRRAQRSEDSILALKDALARIEKQNDRISSQITSLHTQNSVQRE